MSDLWGMGGANNAIGLDHQDNAAIAMVFKALDDPDFQKLTVEHKNDFELVYNDHIVSVQVKGYMLGLAEMGRLVAKAPEGRSRYVLLADSYGNARSFINVFNTFLENPEDYMEFEDEVCSKLNLERDASDFSKAMLFRFEEFSQLSGEQLALSEISKWAARTNRQCDSVKVMTALKLPFLEKRKVRGTISKKQIIKISDDNRVVPSYAINRDEEDNLGFFVDLDAYVKSLIEDTAHNSFMVSELQQFRRLVREGSPDALPLASQLSEENSRYFWLKMSMCVIAREKVLLGKSTPEPSCEFERLVLARVTAINEKWREALETLESLDSESLYTNVNFIKGVCCLNIEEFELAKKFFLEALTKGNSYLKAHIYCHLFKIQQILSPSTLSMKYLDLAEAQLKKFPPATLLKIRHYDSLGQFENVLSRYDELEIQKLMVEKQFSIYPLILIAEQQTHDVRLRQDMFNFLNLVAQLPKMRDCRSAIIYVNNEMVQFFVIQFEKNRLSLSLGDDHVTISTDDNKVSGVSIQVPAKETVLRLPFTPEGEKIFRERGKMPTQQERNDIFTSKQFQKKFGYPTIYTECSAEEYSRLQNTEGFMLNHNRVDELEYVTILPDKLDVEINFALYAEHATIYVRIGSYGINISLDKIGEATRLFAIKLRDSSIDSVIFRAITPGKKKSLLFYVPKAKCQLIEH
ncbi:hypothetical protein Lpp123_01084 [Lacticaseibacillus paracasei subsp. paracasei Lpp123]|uniref:Uncharacterized protein n=1 Tax=Lacticaseibacillus paracasei subsp. paracasei Lpp123 TaxID=1256201 RepID=A0A829GL23_LACPA|nr:hypothetical protein Lpp123_01084 [Lacticaseibacillus paracasei subsp. paracasei Lpp123]